ncbi:MAG: hypothetical protein U5K72_04260 [Balneolaceae bacterium]|nr:hypothetical protein [Balneolaceae bacterium]
MSEDYWQIIWDWYGNGGTNHVAAFLKEYDLSNFDPKAPPPKTDGFWEIVDSNRAPEDAELADALDKLNNPDAVTINMVAEAAGGDFYDWLNDRRNNRQIPHRFETAGYIRVKRMMLQKMVYGKLEANVLQSMQKRNFLNEQELKPHRISNQRYHFRINNQCNR